jgi:DNA-binding phage protein
MRDVKYFFHPRAWQPNPHPIIEVLRRKRVWRRQNMESLAKEARLCRATLEKRENDGRWGGLEQLERWALALGFRLTLMPIDHDDGAK